MKNIKCINFNTNYSKIMSFFDKYNCNSFFDNIINCYTSTTEKSVMIFDNSCLMTPIEVNSKKIYIFSEIDETSFFIQKIKKMVYRQKIDYLTVITNIENLRFLQQFTVCTLNKNVIRTSFWINKEKSRQIKKIRRENEIKIQRKKIVKKCLEDIINKIV